MTAPESDPVLLLHEERPEVRVQRVATGAVRLQRVVVRERRTIEVEVAHEEFRVVPVDAADVPAVDVPAGPRSASVVLREERIEVVRRLVPVERVTVHVEPVSGVAEHRVELRHEEASADLPGLGPVSGPQRP